MTTWRHWWMVGILAWMTGAWAATRDLATPVEMALGVTQTGTLAYGDAEAFHLHLDVDGPLSLRYAPRVAKPLGIEVRAGAVDGPVQASISNAMPSKVVYLSYLPAGEYYVIIRQDNTTVGTVTYSLLADTSLSTTPITDPVSLPSGGATGIYPIQATVAGPLHILVQKPQLADTLIHLYGANISGQPLVEERDTYGQLITLNAASPGTYYLVVCAMNAADPAKPCTISVTQSPPSVTPSAPVSGQFTAASQMALYRAQATAGNPLFISLTKSVPWAGYLEVRQGTADGPLVAVVDRAAATPSTLADQWLEISAPVTGPYYILVEPFDRLAPMPTACAYTLAVTQSLPMLSDTAVPVTFAGAHTVRWYRMPASGGEPLYAIADHNSENKVRMTLVKDSIQGAAVAEVNTAKDSLVYLAQAENARYYLRAGDATLASCALSGGRHLPFVSAGVPADGAIVNGSDVYWFEIPVAAGEHVALRLTKDNAFATNLPMLLTTPANAPKPAGTKSGDVVELLAPTVATTYFARVSGEPGHFSLSADRIFPALTLGQYHDAVMAHAGSERWFEVTVPANTPLFLATDKVQGTDTRVLVYRDGVRSLVAQFGGASCDYTYLPGRSQATRYLVRKQAPDANFTADGAERIYAGSTLPPLIPGQTDTGTLGSAYQQRFYSLTMPVGRPLALRSSANVTLIDPVGRKTLPIGMNAAVAGMTAPTVAMVSSTTSGSYTITALIDLSEAALLYYSNWSLEATVDLRKTTVGRLKCFYGSNTYLGGDGAGAQYLLQPEGTDYATGWLLTEAATDGSTAQLTWHHPVMQVTKSIRLQGTTQHAQVICQIDTPRPLVFRNALQPPAAQFSGFSYAIPTGPVTSGEFSLTGNGPLYPAGAGGMVTPSEGWVAFWNSGMNEVYGYTVGSQYRLGLATDGGYVVTRIHCPAGASTFTAAVVYPKTDPPYAAVKNLVNTPALGIDYVVDAYRVPLGSPLTGTVMVRNVGRAQATNVFVSATVPASVQYVEGSASGNGGYYAKMRTVNWSVGTLNAGESRVLTYRVMLDPMTVLGTEIEMESAARSTEQPAASVARCVVLPSAPTLLGVTPAQPGNRGPVTLTLRGACLSPHATVTLMQGAQTLATTVSDVNPERTELCALADVTGLTGDWDARISNPGGATATLPRAVVLATGGAGGFWCELTGPPTLQQHAWNTLTVQYGNRGPVDEVGRLLVLYLPAGKYLMGSVRDARGVTLASSGQATSQSGPLLLWVPRVGAESSHTLWIEIQPQQLRAVGTQYPEITLLTCPLPREELTRLARLSTINGWQVAIAHQPAMAAAVSGAVDTVVAAWASALETPGWAIGAEIARAARGAASLAGYVPTNDIDAVGGLLDGMVSTLKAGNGFSPLTTCRVYTPSVTTTGPTVVKTGPVGVSALGYLTKGQPFRYQISVNNPVGAGAPVKQVHITDTLDASLDWSTLSLGDIRIGGITLATKQTFPFHAFVDLRPAVNAIAEVTVTFDPALGKLEWDVAGAHPVTGTRHDLLLPNTAANAPWGGLDVAFTILPKADVQSGKAITNTAYITMDAGVPTATNTVISTIDAGPPASAVQALPEVQEADQITVTWQGQDDANGAGLANYSIYVSVDNGPFTLWKDRVTYTSAAYTGQLGHTYAFYSRAEDFLGQVEPVKAGADAAIRIGKDTRITRGLHLVSVPMLPDVADPKQYLGFSASRWACYQPGVGYVNYGNDPERISWFTPAASVPGRGFWGYWQETTLLNPTGTPTPTSAPYSIALIAGWNLIGNPWPKSVAWDPVAIQVTRGGETLTLAQAAQAGWVDDYAWGWVPNTANPDTGKYWMVGEASQPGTLHTLEPWQGYWIKAGRECALLLPVPTILAGQQASAGPAARRLWNEGWQVQLTASSADDEDSFNWFGVGHRAAVQRAERITSPPMPPHPAVELTFAHGAGGSGPIALREQGAVMTWHFTVAAPVPGDTVTLRWPDLTAVPAWLGLTLVNDQTGERRYLRTTWCYQFTAPRDGSPAAFHIEAAPRGSFMVQGLRVRHGGIRGEGLAVEFQVTQDAEVTLELRAVSGRLLRQLAIGPVAANTPIRYRVTEPIEASPGTPLLVVLRAVNAEGRLVRVLGRGKER